MFDIGWGEFLVIGIVALIVIGPRELPGVLRTIGQGISKIRRMASEFQGQFQEAMREAEMAELKKSVDEVSAAARGFTYYDPMNPDGLEPKAEAKAPDAAALPAPQEPSASPSPVESSEPALPAPDLGPVETPKRDEGRSS
jgi:sec-independent protein translocase protein TatB